MRRTKQSDKRYVTMVSMYMTSTRHATDTKNCCRMKFAIHVNRVSDFYYIQSGCGVPHLNNHPKIKMYELFSGSTTVAEESVLLRNQIQKKNASASITHQVVRDQSGRQLS